MPAFAETKALPKLFESRHGGRDVDRACRRFPSPFDAVDGFQEHCSAKVRAMDLNMEVVTQRWNLWVWHRLQIPHFSTAVTKTVTGTKKKANRIRLTFP